MSERVISRMTRQTRFGPDHLTLKHCTLLSGEEIVALEIDETTDPIDGRQKSSYLLDRPAIASLLLGLLRAADALPGPDPMDAVVAATLERMGTAA